MILGIKLFILIAALFGMICAIGLISDTIASVISKEYQFEIALIIAIFFICMAVGLLIEYVGGF